jgi:NAD(P)-dependent dehydrogenase (short-subunit alcohol dehydrogenase family)
MALSLQGQGVIITGAGSGLGEAVAHLFAKEGAGIACVDCNEAAIQSVVQGLQKQDIPHIALHCDVSNETSVFETVQKTIEQFGRLDIIVNCAAIDHTLSLEEMSVAQWDHVVGVNLRGPFLFAKAAWPFMKRQQRGHIFNVASTAALRSWANASAYHATKRGLIGLSQGLGVEGRPYGIRVSTIIPGGMKTHFFDRFVDQGIPLPDRSNLQRPETVAAAILFVAQVPAESNVQELLLTPCTETSWP